jgi:hypothetical protein
MRWAGHVAHVREMRNAYKILDGKPERNRQLEDIGVDGKIILEWILGKWGRKMWTGCIWLRIGTSVITVMKRSGSINGGEFRD